LYEALGKEHHAGGRLDSQDIAQATAAPALCTTGPADRPGPSTASFSAPPTKSPSTHSNTNSRWIFDGGTPWHTDNWQLPKGEYTDNWQQPKGELDSSSASQENLYPQMLSGRRESDPERYPEELITDKTATRSVSPQGTDQSGFSF